MWSRLEPARRVALAAVVFATCACACAAGLPARAQASPAAPTAGEIPEFSGFARLFNVDALTVVYPAGDDAPPHARLVAERLAAFLSARHAPATRVVADRDVGPEERSGHLLLLGWTNDLLDPDRPGGVAPPWLRDDRGFALSEEVRGGPDDDLLFVHPSPFADGRLLGFWSRVDAERARFSPIPALGADWGIFRLHLGWTRGLFETGGAWPPRVAPYQVVSDIASLPAEQTRSAHFAVHHDPGRIGERELQRAIEARESAFATAERLLQPAPDGFRIELYLYRDTEEKIRRTGVPDPVHDVAERGELHMTLDHAVSPSPLEEIQLLARALHGPCYHTAFCEGLPLAHMQDASAAEDELGIYAGLLLDTDTVPPVDEILDEEALRAAVDAGRGYAAATLFVDWLLHATDPPTFWTLYGTAGLDAAGVAETLGRATEGADPAFRAYLERRGASAREETEFRKALATAFDARADGDEAGARAAFRRALALRPDDLETRYRLALSLRDAGRDDAAQAEFLDVVKRAEGRKPSYFLTHALYEAAELARRAGRAEAARALYRRALALPDVQGSHELSDEGLADLDADDD